MDKDTSTEFGKASVLKLFNNKDGSTHLEWAHQPKSVLLIEKIHDACSRRYLVSAAQHLFKKRHFHIYVEDYVIPELKNFAFLQAFESEATTRVDFVLSFGGDGTLLHISKLFPSACPPIIPFAMGSLGFLTPFLADDYEKVVDSLIRGFFYVTSRTRILCDIKHLDGTVETHQAMNDVVFSPRETGSVCAIDCLIDGKHFTTVYGDGLIIATSTGSTAYNLSTGGAMVHPSVSSLIWAPICAHALNAHPLVLPDSVKLSMQIAEHARGDDVYMVVYDSIKTVVRKGESVTVRISPYPIPTVCQQEPMTDWLSSISTVLRWNQPMQITLPSEEENQLPVQCPV